MEARPILERGSRWRVGDGNSIPANCGVEYVSDLISSESAYWLPDLVNELFLSCDATQILSIPLSGRLPSDKLMWHYDANGLFFGEKRI